jgi:hypothetical protein
VEKVAGRAPLSFREPKPMGDSVALVAPFGFTDLIQITEGAYDIAARRCSIQDEVVLALDMKVC